MSLETPAAVILGTAQDAGYPSAGCRRDCCRRALADPGQARHPACMAVLDGAGGRWLIDCTPHFPQQLALLDRIAPAAESSPLLQGIFLTHAHIGHYTGLMHLGREVLGSSKVPVYCMPRMKRFLEDNGPWDQLVRLGNIELRELDDADGVELPGGVRIEAMRVPHRAEYSETVAYIVSSARRRILFLPDLDSWEELGQPLPEILGRMDLAFVDGTFFSGAELPGRDMAEIPHPSVEHTMQLLADCPAELKARLHFFHLNHTNPLLNQDSPESMRLLQAGFRIARQAELIRL